MSMRKAFGVCGVVVPMTLVGFLGCGSGGGGGGADPSCDDASCTAMDGGDDGSTGQGDSDGSVRDSGSAQDEDAGAHEGEDSGPRGRSAEGLLDTYLPCEVSADCAVGVCVTSVPFNRIDKDGTRAIAIRDVLPGWPASGVCTRTCSSSATECDTLTLVDPNDGQSYPFTCQVIAQGLDPYAHSETSLPFTVDLDEVMRGRAFAALCRPPFGRHPKHIVPFCEPCTSSDECGGGTCARAEGGALAAGETGVCLEPCGSDEDCVPGFTCDAQASLCVPTLGTCGACRDDDGDGFGLGFCGGKPDAVTAHDCDDQDKGTWPERNLSQDTRFRTHCAVSDINCNGAADDAEIVGEGPFGAEHCGACFDACTGTASQGEFKCLRESEGSESVCTLVCDAQHADCDGEAENGCETLVTDPSRLYYRDFDGDGHGDPNTPRFDCDGSGVPAGYVADASDCDDQAADVYGAGPAGAAAAEICDGRDNDCNDAIDDLPELGAPCEVPLQVGVCANGVYSCEGASGAPVCAQTVSASPELCDGLDNDCDGTPDNPEPTPCDMADPNLQGICKKGHLSCKDAPGLAPICEGNKKSEDDPIDLPLGQTSDDVDTNCDGMDGDAERLLFVLPSSGHDKNAGTRDKPLRTFGEAVRRFKAQPDAYDGILIAGDPADETTTWTLSPNMVVVGGMQHSNGVWRYPTNATSRSKLGFTVAQAVEGTGISDPAQPTALYNLHIKAANATAPSESSYGIVCVDCAELRLSNVTFEAGAGAAGSDGQDGYQGSHGGRGDDGQWGYSGDNRAPGKPGEGCNWGGWGGWGWYFLAGPKGGEWGDPGGGPAGGYAGWTPDDGWWYEGGHGGHGGGGAGGSGGAAGKAPAFTMSGKLGAAIQAGAGGDGACGSGGGGGGGGGIAYLTTHAGGGGGGGGAGGGGGGGGKGGWSGGASVGGVFVRRPGDRAFTFPWTNVLFEGKAGGNGGAGKAGGNGGNGGDGGNNGSTGGSMSGGKGGHGGSGGGGGGGGGGAGGPSYGLLLLVKDANMEQETSHAMLASPTWQDTVKFTCSSVPAAGGPGGGGGSEGWSWGNRGGAGSAGTKGPDGAVCDNGDKHKFLFY